MGDTVRCNNGEHGSGDERGFGKCRRDGPWCVRLDWMLADGSVRASIWTRRDTHETKKLEPQRLASSRGFEVTWQVQRQRATPLLNRISQIVN